MSNHSLRVRAASFGALLLLVSAACHDSNRRAPGAGTGSGDLVNTTKPGLYGLIQVEVVGPGTTPGSEPDADALDPTRGPSGLMPPRIGAEIRIDAGLITWLDGLDVAAILRGDAPDGEVLAWRNEVGADGVDFMLDRRLAAGHTEHVELALSPTDGDALAGVVHYLTTAPERGVPASGSFRVVLERIDG